MQLDLNAVTGGRATRKNRQPVFPLAGTMKPYGLYPLMIHPVLPGETLQSVSTKLSLVSLPIKHPLMGAWFETWTCYVKFTDLDRDLGQMFVSDSYSTTGWTQGSSSSRYFTKSGQIAWVQKCAERIHDAYFVHDNETPRTIDGVRQVKLNNRSWYQNMIFEPAASAVPTTDASDTYADLQGWMMLQQMNMTELTYEKYLETYGARPARLSEGDPEILRFSRSWTKPVNVIDPTDGTPASAWVWNDEIKADKPKRFNEPGFVIQLATVRPKMFQKYLDYSMVGNLWGFSDWYPSYTLDDPTSSVKTINTADPVFNASHRTDAGELDMKYDHKDLLNHGEQFINDSTHPYTLYTSTYMQAQDASTPEALRGEYCYSSDVDNMFVGADKRMYYDGITMLNISGHVQDTTR